MRWCHSLLSDEFAQQRRSESHGNIDLAYYFFQFSSFDLLTKLGGKRPSHSGRNSLFWKVCIFITTLFYYLNPALGPCAFFVYLRAFFFVVLHQHPLMVQGASSSKSNLSSRSMSSTHSSFKVGPPTKKPYAVSMAKAKNTKQQSIKKYVRKGKHFFC